MYKTVIFSCIAAASVAATTITTNPFITFHYHESFLNLYDKLTKGGLIVLFL
jgi:hypothetical protein